MHRCRCARPRLFYSPPSPVRRSLEAITVAADVPKGVSQSRALHVSLSQDTSYTGAFDVASVLEAHDNATQQLDLTPSFTHGLACVRLQKRIFQLP